MQTRELEVCKFCYQFIANADLTSLDFHYSTGEADQRAIDIFAGVERLTKDGSFLVPLSEVRGDEGDCECCEEKEDLLFSCSVVKV